MKKYLIILLSLMYLHTIAQGEAISLEGASDGSLERIESFPSKFVKARNIDIWLPDNYSTEKEYAVLYMHDGQMLYDATKSWNKQEWAVDEVMGRLIRDSKVRECIVVGVWNAGEDRHADYFPQKPFESLDKNLQDSLINKALRYGENSLFSHDVSSDGYLKFLTSELKPYIDQHYSTKTERENTFIAGSSMGGLISWYAVCEYPEIYGGAACLSTHWVGTFDAENNPIPQAFVDYLKKNLPDPATHKFYFDYGTETLDALYEPFQKQVDAVIKTKGYTSKNWMTQKFEGANHSEDAWSKRLHIPFTFLLKTN